MGTLRILALLAAAGLAAAACKKLEHAALGPAPEPTAVPLPTATPAVPAAVAGTLVDNFDNAPYGYASVNRSDLGGYTDDDSTMFTTVQGDTVQSGFLQLAWQSAADYWYTTFDPDGAAPTACVDYSAKTGLALHARGLVGGETFRLHLESKPSAGCSGTTSKPYVTVGPLTTSWQLYSFPFTSFTPLDATQARGISIDTFSTATGTIHVTNIVLTP